MMSEDGSVESPIYSKVLHNEKSATKWFFIVCDEGWRSSIVCEHMYEWCADWLIELIQGRPFVKDVVVVIEKGIRR